MIAILKLPAPVIEIGIGPEGVLTKSSQFNVRSSIQVIVGPWLSPITLKLLVTTELLPQSSVAVQR